MNVLFLMIAYPDVSDNSSMYTDLAQEFASGGYNVSVVVANGPGKTRISIEGGINVLRVRTWELFNTSFIKKGLANILLPRQVSKGIKRYMEGIHLDTVIVSTPPITYLSTVKKLKQKFNSRVYLILRDIFPQNAKDLGIIKNPLVLKFFRKLEKRLYSVSDFIGCMSQGNIDYIKKHNSNINESKLHIIPNWKNVTEYSQPDVSLKKQYGLDNKFIALYGGNFGKPQQIDFILELANEVAGLQDVIFLLVGEGSEKQRIIDLVSKRKLSNVIIKKTLPRNQYHELAKICDIGLVNLSARFTIPNIPSRTLSYWEAKIPILAAIDENTDYSCILEESGSGIWSITGDIDSYKKNFEKLYLSKELRIKMGENGYNYLKENCTTSKAFTIIHEKLISQQLAI